MVCWEKWSFKCSFNGLYECMYVYMCVFGNSTFKLVVLLCATLLLYSLNIGYVSWSTNLVEWTNAWRAEYNVKILSGCESPIHFNENVWNSCQSLEIRIEVNKRKMLEGILNRCKWNTLVYEVRIKEQISVFIFNINISVHMQLHAADKISMKKHAVDKISMQEHVNYKCIHILAKFDGCNLKTVYFD